LPKNAAFSMIEAVFLPFLPISKMQLQVDSAGIDKMQLFARF
jgi:hypothetical protein